MLNKVNLSGGFFWDAYENSTRATPDAQGDRRHLYDDFCPFNRRGMVAGVEEFRGDGLYCHKKRNNGAVGVIMEKHVAGEWQITKLKCQNQNAKSMLND